MRCFISLRQGLNKGKENISKTREMEEIKREMKKET